MWRGCRGGAHVSVADDDVILCSHLWMVRRPIQQEMDKPPILSLPTRFHRVKWLVIRSNVHVLSRTEDRLKKEGWIGGPGRLLSGEIRERESKRIRLVVNLLNPQQNRLCRTNDLRSERPNLFGSQSSKCFKNPDHIINRTRFRDWSGFNGRSGMTRPIPHSITHQIRSPRDGLGCHGCSQKV